MKQLFFVKQLQSASSKLLFWAEMFWCIISDTAQLGYLKDVYLFKTCLDNASSIYRYCGPNTGNVHIIADLYAEVIGVLTQSK